MLQRFNFPIEVIWFCVFLVLCLGIWWLHEIWISEILKFNFLEKKKSFWSEIKQHFSKFTSALFKYKKQNSKNVADTTFKFFWCIVFLISSMFQNDFTWSSWIKSLVHVCGYESGNYSNVNKTSILNYDITTELISNDFWSKTRQLLTWARALSF